MCAVRVLQSLQLDAVLEELVPLSDRFAGKRLRLLRRLPELVQRLRLRLRLCTRLRLRRLIAASSPPPPPPPPRRHLA